MPKSKKERKLDAKPARLVLKTRTACDTLVSFEEISNFFSQANFHAIPWLFSNFFPKHVPGVLRLFRIHKKKSYAFLLF